MAWRIRPPSTDLWLRLRRPVLSFVSFPLERLARPLRGNRLCWLETQQSLYAIFPLRDAQSLPRRAVDLAAYRQVID
jgi:hypothetical protein